MRLDTFWPTARRDLLLLGAYLSLRGYRSFDGDQAYRLPLLLQWIDQAIYATDPFVRSFDDFNPHRGWISLLWLLTSTIGLSAGLLLIFIATFIATCRGVGVLTQATWPEKSRWVSTVGVLLVLAAKAGNIGTNHLFESTLLDRLTALALGWNAVAELVARPGQGGTRVATLLGLATLLHPSLGLQLSLIVASVWVIGCFFSTWTEVSTSRAIRNIVWIAIGIAPGLVVNLQHGDMLQQGLAPDDFWTLAVELQGPQHMLPHLWRMPQWLAFGSYFAIAGLSLLESRELPKARRRFLLILVVVLVWLAAGWVGIEVLRHTRVTVFQPFRMATLARGLALVLIAGRLVSLWAHASWFHRTRVVLMVIGLTGDWLMVLATAVELCSTLGEAISRRLDLRLTSHSSTSKWKRALSRGIPVLCFGGTLAAGLRFLASHDTESGHRTAILVLSGWLMIELVYTRFPSLRRVPKAFADEDRAPVPFRQKRAVVALAWMIPSLAALAVLVPAESRLGQSSVVRGLIARCRFAAVPIDDMERLAVWCRENTPRSARFVGPPGPKTFRLWSRRSLVFNRAGSPYHAAGLADWFTRFKDVVGSADTPKTFVRRYQTARHELERGYDRQSPSELAELAVRQGADHLVAAAPSGESMDSLPQELPPNPLLLLHIEGRLAVYQVDPEFARTRAKPGQMTLHTPGLNRTE